METAKESAEETTSTIQENTLLTWEKLVDRANKRIQYQQQQTKTEGHNFSSPEAREACARFVPSWILNLRATLEEKIYSQFGEDGITRYILQNLAPASLANNSSSSSSTTQGNDKYYVEFGVEDGAECNTRFLRQLYNWTGLLMDGGFFKPTIGLQREMIHPDNVVALFEKYNVPKSFGLLSEDTDYSDYYIWQRILQAGYRPRVLISEFNSNFMGDNFVGRGSAGLDSEETAEQELFESESVTVHAPRPGQVRRWDGTDYFGVSALALKRKATTTTDTRTVLLVLVAVAAASSSIIIESCAQD